MDQRGRITESSAIRGLPRPGGYFSNPGGRGMYGSAPAQADFSPAPYVASPPPRSQAVGAPSRTQQATPAALSVLNRTRQSPFKPKSPFKSAASGASTLSAYGDEGDEDSYAYDDDEEFAPKAFGGERTPFAQAPASASQRGRTPVKTQSPFKKAVTPRVVGRAEPEEEEGALDSAEDFDNADLGDSDVNPTRHTISNGDGCVTLVDHQLEHFQKLGTILNKWSFALDRSSMGTGKTYTSLACALLFRIPLLIICPSSLVLMWEERAREVGAEVYMVLSYRKLSSVKCLHGLLTAYKPDARNDGSSVMGAVDLPNDEDINAPADKARVKKRSGGTTKFNATRKLMDRAEKGLMVIFDEFHNIRNLTAQTNACHEIVRALLESNAVKNKRIFDGEEEAENTKFSMVLGLSGTPATTPEEYIRHMHFLGLIKAQRLFQTMPNGVIKLIGARELIEVCAGLDQNATNAVLQRSVGKLSNAASVREFCFDLYTDVIQHHLVSEMPPIPSKMIPWNGIFILDYFPDDAEMFESALTDLVSDAWGADNITERPSLSDLGRNDARADYLLEQLAKNAAMNPDAKLRSGTKRQRIELSKVRSVVMYAMIIRHFDPRAKIVILWSFLDTISRTLEVMLSDWGIKREKIGILMGSVKMAERKEIERRFQLPTPLGDEAEEEMEGENDDAVLKTLIKGSGADDGPIDFIIANITVASAGLNLHDTHGNEPRTIFITPSGSITTMHQATGRVNRYGSKSTATAYVTYATTKEVGIPTQNDWVGPERNIYRALYEKSEVYRRTLLGQVEANMKFPGDYPSKPIDLEKEARKLRQR
jgi:hypothetical protein